MTTVSHVFHCLPREKPFATDKFSFTITLHIQGRQFVVCTLISIKMYAEASKHKQF